MNTYYWLRQATSKIRFAPDRDAVRRELAGHLEERVEAEKTRGLSQGEAESIATAAMGDPDALAEELGRIHSPWWGYCWRASRAVLILAAVFAVCGVLADREALSLGSRPELPEKTSTYVTQRGMERSVMERWHPKGAKNLGGYRFTAPLAWVEQWTVEYEDLDGTMVHTEPCRLTVCLRADTWRFWEPCSTSQHLILNGTAADSQGNQYVYDGERMDCRGLFCETWQEPFTSWYLVYLDLPGPEDLPEWVDLPVGYGGDTIHVDLKGEVMR